jgi:hypothetical protein
MANSQPNGFTTKDMKSLKKRQALIVVSGGGVPFVLFMVRAIVLVLPPLLYSRGEGSRRVSVLAMSTAAVASGHIVAIDTSGHRRSSC